jgi:hypothetical protein
MGGTSPHRLFHSTRKARQGYVLLQQTRIYTGVYKGKRGLQSDQEHSTKVKTYKHAIEE